jgi:membrane dipeptidase
MFMYIVDGHLDLSYNALRGRDVLAEAARQTADEDGIPSVGLPDLRRGGVELILATIFCEPSRDGKPGYTSPQEAAAAGWAQLDWYRKQEQSGEIEIVQSAGDLTCPSDRLKAIILMEGADPILNAADASRWREAGVRVVGLAWRQTRYAGGTGAPGPLSAEGRELVAELDRLRIVHDLSHLAEDSFWELLDRTQGRVIASHSNCRAIVPTDRQLSDAMLRAVAARGGIIGINFYDRFLLRPDEYGKRRATLADVALHAKHMANVIGDALHIGLGTDMDGGLGRDEIPVEIKSSADLPRVAEALSAAGFADTEVNRIIGLSWRDFFEKAYGDSIGQAG